LKSVRITGDARRLRAVAYMPVGDQLDAVSELARALREQGFSLPPKTAEWLQHCERVKALHPKHLPAPAPQD